MAAMQIFVKTLTTERCSFVVSETCEIRELKGSISTPFGCPPHLMRLIFEGTELHNVTPLRDCNIRDGAVLLLLRRGQLQPIQQALHELLFVVKKMEDAVIAHEAFEKGLADAVDASLGSARAFTG